MDPGRTVAGSRQTGVEASGPEKGKTWQLLLAGLVFYLGLGLWTTTVYPPTGDEPHYLLMTHSLLHEHDLDLTDNLQRRDYLKFYPGPGLDFHAAPTPRAALISKHFPLVSWLILPGYALAGRFGAAAIMLLVASCLAWFIYRWAREISASESWALAAWAWALFSPPLATYFDLIYTELPATLVLLWGLWHWHQGQSRGILLAALAAAILPWFYPKYIPLAALLGLALFWARGANWKNLLGAACVALVSGALFLIFFRSFYSYGIGGNPFGEIHPVFSRHSLNNALGLFVDRDFGMLAIAPLLALGLAGLLSQEKARLRLVVMCLLVLLVEWGLYVVFDDFTGCSSVFSRHILPGTLMLLAFVPEGWKTAAGLETLGQLAGHTAGRIRNHRGLGLRRLPAAALFCAQANPVGSGENRAVYFSQPGAAPGPGCLRLVPGAAGGFRNPGGRDRAGEKNRRF